jgi:hypothetical protein
MPPIAKGLDEAKIGFVALLLLVAGSARPPVVAQGGMTVDRWGRFEAALNNARSYSNRYTDVSLDVIYTRPDGSTVSFWGFYDIVKRVWDFFASIPFYEMSPRQDLVSTGYCLAAAGQRYLVYLPSRVTVNLSVTNGSYEVLWINAQNPADRRAGGTTTSGQNLAPPVDGDDWLLYLKRSDATDGAKTRHHP